MLFHGCSFFIETTNRHYCKNLLPTSSFFFGVEPCTSSFLLKSWTPEGLFYSGLNPGLDVSFFKVELCILHVILQLKSWISYLIFSVEPCVWRWILDLTPHSSRSNFYAIYLSSNLKPEPNISSSLIILPSTPRSSKWSLRFRFCKVTIMKPLLH